MLKAFHLYKHIMESVPTLSQFEFSRSQNESLIHKQPNFTE